ncbi:transglutaminase domain-containing protein [Protaetiibacter sp. SSC-01]|uniref:transglutaminase domain-containing protein n=1 Tax=Protaetiibacter sp. SSC-01 TaxID=2759943 RepID=UPI00165754DC|nr:transglutaminase-like domain-containing protein [Protaetiibacter sp. SSC-01]QNO38543.1 transglutaminase domain-containing protein [Protaetiibacter sp. SSC-01]
MRGRLTLASLGDVLQLWLMLAIASATLWPVYRSASFVVLAVSAVLIGTLIAALGALFRWKAWIVLLITVGAFTAVGVPLAVPSKTVSGVLPTVDGLVDLYAGVALGWKQLLTITLPVGDYQALLVPALVLLLSSTVVAMSIGLRSRYGEYAVIPPVIVFIAGIVFGPATATIPIPLGIGLLVSGIGWISWRRWRRRREATRGREREIAAGLRIGVETRALIGGILVFAIAAFGSVATASVLTPEADRHVLRTVVEQPFEPRDHTSPLAGFRRYLRDDRVDEVMMRVTGLPAEARIRIAALDSYDGVVYAVGSASVDSASGVFVRVPSRVDQSASGGERVRLDVAIDGYAGVWVPTVGLLEDIAFRGDDRSRLEDGFAFNTTSGTAVDLEGVGTGDRYLLDAVVRRPVPLERLATAVPGSADVPRGPEAPEELATALEVYLEGVDGAGAQLVAAIENLRAEGYISHGLSPDEPASRAGHSLDRIAELFDGSRMIGDAEQYAVAAALIATRLGFPARVVVGFAPEVAPDGGETIVRGGDITAWIEVSTAHDGWVAIDPVPPERPIPEEEPEEPTPISRPESIVPPPVDRPEPREEQVDSDTTADEPAVPDSTLEVLLQAARIIGIGALVILVALSPFLLVIGAKARRRQLRRKAPTPLDRIRGGWDEFADIVVDRGLAAPPSATRAEFAAAVGTLPSRVLAAVVDRAVFAPEPPSDADAERVWSAVGELRHSLDATRTRRERVRALVSVRSLGGGAVRQLLRRPRSVR